MTTLKIKSSCLKIKPSCVGRLGEIIALAVIREAVPDAKASLVSRSGGGKVKGDLVIRFGNGTRLHLEVKTVISNGRNLNSTIDRGIKRAKRSCSRYVGMLPVAVAISIPIAEGDMEALVCSCQRPTADRSLTLHLGMFTPPLVVRVCMCACLNDLRNASRLSDEQGGGE